MSKKYNIDIKDNGNIIIDPVSDSAIRTPIRIVVKEEYLLIYKKIIELKGLKNVTITEHVEDATVTSTGKFSRYTKIKPKSNINLNFEIKS